MTKEINPYHASFQKRAVDVIAGSALLLAAAPAEALVEPRLKACLDEGPFYFRQQRLGGIITKLRTMRHPEPGRLIESVWDSSDVEDSRIPSFARKIKQLRIDEIPQIFEAVADAVQGGERQHSIVSIRPLLEEHANEYLHLAAKYRPEQAERWRYEVLPSVQHGLISLAATKHSRRTSNNDLGHLPVELMQYAGDSSEELARLAFALDWIDCDVQYYDHGSLRTDLQLLGQAAIQLGALTKDVLYKWKKA